MFQIFACIGLIRRTKIIFSRRIIKMCALSSPTLSYKKHTGTINPHTFILLLDSFILGLTSAMSTLEWLKKKYPVL
jgi:hypothetical protein